MAKIFPQKLLEADKNNPRFSSEIRMYELFNRELPDEFTVFYNVAYQLKKKTENAYDGEADFVIAHPELGLIVIEVKGGRIRYEGSNKQWYSKDRNDNEYSIKDPFIQVRKNHYSLRYKLQEAPITNVYQYSTGYAVCFPDIQVPACDINLYGPST